MNNETQIHVHYQPNNINEKKLKIMAFLMNALEKGWCIKKKR